MNLKVGCVLFQYTNQLLKLNQIYLISDVVILHRTEFLELSEHVRAEYRIQFASLLDVLFKLSLIDVVHCFAPSCNLSCPISVQT